MPAPTPTRAELDDLTLARARRGDDAACRALVTRYQHVVFAVLSRMLMHRGDRALVEDLAQETFLRVFRALPGFDVAGPARLSTWILTIASRLALDELRKKPRALDAVDDSHASSVRTEAGATDRQLGLAIESAVASLGPDFQSVFILSEFHELSHDEIARALDVETGTVKSRLSRARASLRTALARFHHDH